jgi:hypothetical protein
MLHLTTICGIAAAGLNLFSSCPLILIILLYGLRDPAMAGAEVFGALGEPSALRRGAAAPPPQKKKELYIF